MGAMSKPLSPIHDPLGDDLITPQNAAFVLIDDQPSKFAAIRSLDPDLLLENIVSTVELANLFELSIAFKLRRDWAREETVPGGVEIVFTECLLPPAGQGAH